MWLTVIGATGGTGRQLVTQALAAGHKVTAVARRPDQVPKHWERVTVHPGDVLDRESLDGAVDGAEAVISALGIGYRRHATVVYSAGTANVIDAMKTAGARRLLVVSTSGIEVPDDAPVSQRLFHRQVLQRVLHKPYQDIRQMETIVQGSDLDWTIVRATRLTNGKRTGRYRTSRNAYLHGGWSISRADLAHYLVNQLNDSASHGSTVEIGY